MNCGSRSWIRKSFALRNPRIPSNWIGNTPPNLTHPQTKHKTRKVGICLRSMLRGDLDSPCRQICAISLRCRANKVSGVTSVATSARAYDHFGTDGQASALAIIETAVDDPRAACAEPDSLSADTRSFAGGARSSSQQWRANTN